MGFSIVGTGTVTTAGRGGSFESITFGRSVNSATAGFLAGSRQDGRKEY